MQPAKYVQNPVVHLPCEGNIHNKFTIITNNIYNDYALLIELLKHWKLGVII